MPWILCGPGRPPESTADVAGSTAITLTSLSRSFRNEPAPVIVPPVPTPGDEVVDLAVHRLPQLRAGRPVVDLRVGRVGELVGQEHVRVARHRARGGDGLVHPAHRLGDVHLRAVQAQQPLALAAHALRQREDQLVALGRAHERQRDAGVPARGLDDRRAARLDPSLPLGRLDHGHADAVLDRAAGVEHLELAEHLPAACRGQAGELDHRRAADMVGNVDRNLAHCRS